MAKIIAIANQKGGVAKTTTCVHLACGLAMRGKRVLVIDLDPQGNLSEGLGAKCFAADALTVRDWLGLGDDRNHPKFSGIVRCISVGAAQSFDLLPANIMLDQAELRLFSFSLGRERVLAKSIATVEGRYEYVLIDCRPSVGILTINALTAAHAVLVPVKPEAYSVLALSELARTVNNVRTYSNPRLGYAGFLINMVDKRRNIEKHECDIALVADECKTFVYRAQIRLAKDAADAPDDGKSLFDIAPTKPVTQDYDAFVTEFLQRENDHA
jgi:chromosome partitioning protein